MSNMPPVGSSVGAPQPHGHTDGLAITALVLGIVSFFCGFTLVVPLGAGICAVVALLRIGKPGAATGGRGLAIAGLCLAAVGTVFSLAGAIAIFLPALGRAKELANRSVCGAKLTEIAKACTLYGVDNSGSFPTVPFAKYDSDKNVPMGAAAGPNGLAAISALYGGSSPTDGSPTACLWILVNKGMVKPRNFWCKSDPFFNGPSPETSGGQSLNNFASGDSLSYSITYPWYSDGSTSAAWHSGMDGATPLGSDMAPRNGSGTPPVATDTPPGGPATRVYNSANHNREGQNVVYNDGHTEFLKTPYVGVMNDNIFTVQAGSPGDSGSPIDGASSIDVPAPTNSATPVDTVMVPVRDIKTGGM
jgi:hypothetical protein